MNICYKKINVKERTVVLRMDGRDIKGVESAKVISVDYARLFGVEARVELHFRVEAVFCVPAHLAEAADSQEGERVLEGDRKDDVGQLEERSVLLPSSEHERATVCLVGVVQEVEDLVSAEVVVHQCVVLHVQRHWASRYVHYRLERFPLGG